MFFWHMMFITSPVSCLFSHLHPLSLLLSLSFDCHLVIASVCVLCCCCCSCCWFAALLSSAAAAVVAFAAGDNVLILFFFCTQWMKEERQCRKVDSAANTQPRACRAAGSPKPAQTSVLKGVLHLMSPGHVTIGALTSP